MRYFDEYKKRLFFQRTSQHQIANLLSKRMGAIRYFSCHFSSDLNDNFRISDYSNCDILQNSKVPLFVNPITSSYICGRYYLLHFKHPSQANRGCFNHQIDANNRLHFYSVFYYRSCILLLFDGIPSRTMLLIIQKGKLDTDKYNQIYVDNFSIFFVFRHHLHMFGVYLAYFRSNSQPRGFPALRNLCCHILRFNNN